MFLSSFEKFRIDLNNTTLITMLQLGARAFEEIAGEVVQTVTFVIRNLESVNYLGVYKNLTRAISQNEKMKAFFEADNIFKSQKEYQKIPGSIYAYWISVKAINLFEQQKLDDFVTIKSGIVTGNNNYFLKLWWEINYIKIGFEHKYFIDNSDIWWVPMHKGGGYRKHYGLHEYIMNLHDIWESSKTNESVRRGDTLFYFKKGLTWSTLSNNLSVRYSPEGFVFDTKGSMCFAKNDGNIRYLEAFLNSVVAAFYMSFLSPTLDFNQGALAKIPILIELDAKDQIERISNINIMVCKEEWDSFETSWDFQQHPLVRCASFSRQEMETDAKKHIQDMNYIEDAFTRWSNECYLRFTQLKSNEEELNRIFIDIYGLQDELTPEVEDKDVTVRKADLQRDIKSLISYAVGCMFGRYSLDKEGLIFAGGRMEDKFSYYGGTFADTQDYQLDGKYTFGELGSKFYYIPIEGKKALECWKVDVDNIIPITDDEYFEDDIVEKFITFIRTVYGKQTLEENLKFIADALGGKGQPREVIRNYFLNDFYKDHCKIYQKRPIYWLFDSGKKNGFKCLIYMHRYEPDTIARIRTDYVHEQQSRYRTAIADLEHRIANAGTSERVKLNKSLKKIQEQADELHAYEEKIHHLADQMIVIDLDDGVKHNYEIFKDVLATIK